MSFHPLTFFRRFDWLKLAKITRILVILYLLLVLAICFFKYFTFQYNGLDLAIFNQVFYNSAQGNLFHFTIHPTSYLGDHFSPVILLILPLYAIFKSPLTLIILQSLWLALAVIPLFLIAKKYLSPKLALAAMVLYLFNPATLNINIYEFHLDTLIPLLIFTTFYFYDQSKFKLFLAFAGLSLLIKEDVSFIIFMFGVIAFLDKKSWRWILTPLLASTVYFFAALKIIAHFSAASNYKFLTYYDWLGNSWQEIALNFFLKFPTVILHLLNLGNVELMLGLLLVFLFIPLIKPRYLLLSLGMFVQLVLGPYGGSLVLKMQYGSVFLTAFTIATIFSLESLPRDQKFLNFYSKYKDVFLLCLIVGFIYNFLVIGPLFYFGQNVLATDYREVKLKKEFSREIPAQSPVIATYDLLTPLSSRAKAYSLNYVFLGSQQYGAGPYPIPEDTEFLLINFDDLLLYHMQYAKDLPEYYEGDDNLRRLLAEHNFQLKKVKNNLALWQKDGTAIPFSLYQTAETIPPLQKELRKNLDGKIELLGLNKGEIMTSLYFQPLTSLDKNYFLKINDRIYPLGYGFYPTSEWRFGEIVQLNFFHLGEIKKLQIVNLEGGAELSALASGVAVIDKEELIAEINF